MSDAAVERVSEADRLLVARLEARVQALLRAAQEAQALISEHLAVTYGLTAGDRIEDSGRIARLGPCDPEAETS